MACARLATGRAVLLSPPCLSQGPGGPHSPFRGPRRSPSSGGWLPVSGLLSSTWELPHGQGPGPGLHWGALSKGLLGAWVARRTRWDRCFLGAASSPHVRSTVQTLVPQTQPEPQRLNCHRP